MQTDNTSFTALVRQMRQTQKAYYKERGTANLVAAKQAEQAVDKALGTLPDDRPGIHIGCWYGEDTLGVAQPAAYLGLPPLEDGTQVEGILEHHDQFLDEIDPDGDDKLHAFISKWEQYARTFHLPFDVSEDFEFENGRWQLAVEEEVEAP